MVVDPLIRRLKEKRQRMDALQGIDTRMHEKIRAESTMVRQLERQARAVEARERFMPFVRFTMPDPEDPNDLSRSRYQNAKHHDAIARVLEEVEKGAIPMLILVAPPRHGKSELVSRRLPAWYAGRHPEHDIVVATYNDDFAMDFGAEVRAITNSPAYKQVFPAFKLRRGGNAKDRLQTVQGGLISFVGRGGSLTGRGAHLLVVDDIIKDDREASSPAIRDQAWNWFTKVAMTRRRGNKLVILTFTRWHADDPIGRLTNSNTDENPYYNEELAKRFKIITLPAIAVEDDALGRKPGEPLWPDGPDQFDLDFLEQQRALLGPLGFEALYQGKPTLADGSLFRRENIRFYQPKDLPEDLRIYAASDHAVATGQRNDFTVLIKVGVDSDNNIYVLDCFRAKVPSNVAVEAMLGMAGGKRRPLLWWAERGHISKSIGPFLYKRLAETGGFLNIVEVTPVQDKVQRAQSIVARVAMGKVFLPQWAPWLAAVLDEMLAFPSGVHDDFVDALAYIGLGLQSQFGAVAPSRKKVEPPAGSLAHLRANDKLVKARRFASARGGY